MRLSVLSSVLRVWVVYLLICSTILRDMPLFAWMNFMPLSLKLVLQLAIMIILWNIPKWRLNLLTVLVPWVLMEKTHVFLYLLLYRRVCTCIKLWRNCWGIDLKTNHKPYRTTKNNVRVPKVPYYFERWRIQVWNLCSNFTKWPFINFTIHAFKGVAYETLQCRQYLYIFPGQRSPSFWSYFKLFVFPL